MKYKKGYSNMSKFMKMMEAKNSNAQSAKDAVNNVEENIINNIDNNDKKESDIVNKINTVKDEPKNEGKIEKEIKITNKEQLSGVEKEKKPVKQTNKISKRKDIIAKYDFKDTLSKTVGLSMENEMFFRRRAKQLKFTNQEYITILMEEALNRIDVKDKLLMHEIFQVCRNIKPSKRYRFSVAIPKAIDEPFNNLAATIGVSISDMQEYIVNEERLKEDI